MSSNSSDDYEEEEFLLYVQLDSQSITDEHLRNASKIQLHGIDTPKPLLQVNNLFFQGKITSNSILYTFDLKIFIENSLRQAISTFPWELTYFSKRTTRRQLMIFMQNVKVTTSLWKRLTKCSE